MLLSDISSQLKGQLIGDGNTTIKRICLPQEPSQGSIAVANSQTLLQQLNESDISAIVIDSSLSKQALNKPTIVVEHYKASLVLLLKLFEQQSHQQAHISVAAHIDPSAKTGDNVNIEAHAVIGLNSVVGNQTSIGANTVIGKNVKIGSHCVIHPNVTIYDNSIIEDYVIIHSGTIIGSDGFGYYFDGKQHQKLPHIGNVHIGSHVEIGANTTIDRATIGSTKIDAGTKIDNLVQVAHNVELGKNNILCAFTGIAGSTKVGDNVVFAANVGIGDHVKIEDNVTLGARTGIQPNKRLAKNTTWFGSPGRPKEKAIEQMLLAQRLPQLKKQIQDLKQRLDALEKSTDM